MAFADQLDTTVERIIDEAIDFYMWTEGFTRTDGNYINEGNPEVEVTPPGRPKRTSGGQVYHYGEPASWPFEYGDGPNAGSLVYRHFENRIRDLFEHWRSVPDPVDFDGYIEHLVQGALWIALDGSGKAVGDIGLGVDNALLQGQTEYLKEKIANQSGLAINEFATNFCFPLPTVINGQFAVTLFAAATLGYARATWDKARKDVLAVADKMYVAMKDRGSSDVVDLGTITALFDIASWVPGLDKLKASAETVLGALESLVNPGGEEKKTPVEYAANSPDGVVEKVEKGLKALARDIGRCEEDIHRRVRNGIEDVVGNQSGSFDLPPPGLLGVTEIDEVDVNTDDLTTLATVTIPNIATYLTKATDCIALGVESKSAWYRPTELGVSDSPTGPYDTWAALASLAEGLTADLAWEVTESANHLALVSDEYGRTEAEIEASMRQHAEQLGGGSGYNPIGDAGTWLDKHS